MKLSNRIAALMVVCSVNWVPSVVFAQQQNDQRNLYDTDHPQYLYHPNSLMTLGKGFNVNHPEEEREICGQFDVHRAENNAALSTTVEAHLVRDSRQLKRVLGIDVRMEGRFLIGHAEGRVTSNYELNTSDSSLTMVLIARTDFGRLMTSNYRIFPRYQEMLDAPGGLARFIASCGSHYVTTEFRAATAAVTITLEDVSRDEKESLQASMEGGFNLGIMSGSAKARFESMLQQRAESRNYSISVHSIGGSGMASLSEAISSLLTTGSPLQRMETGMREFLRGFTFDHGAPVRFVASPFPMLRARIDNLSSEERDESLLNIVDTYRNIHRQFLTVQSMVSRRPTSEQREQLRAFPRHVVEGVRTELGSIDNYLHSLAAVQRACLAAPLDQVQRACALPQEPEAPHFMYFRAILETWSHLARKQ